MLLLESQVYRALQDPQPTRRVLIIIIGGDRGLCGMYNRLVLTMAKKRITELIDAGQEIELCCVGRVPLRFCRRVFPQLLVVNSFPLGNSNHLNDLALDISEEALMDFISDEVDRVEMIYTRFVSMLCSKPSIRTFLPVNPIGMEWEEDEIFQLVSEGGNLAVERYPAPVDR